MWENILHSLYVLLGIGISRAQRIPIQPELAYFELAEVTQILHVQDLIVPEIQFGQMIIEELVEQDDSREPIVPQAQFTDRQSWLLGLTTVSHDAGLAAPQHQVEDLRDGDGAEYRAQRFLVLEIVQIEDLLHRLIPGVQGFRDDLARVHTQLLRTEESQHDVHVQFLATGQRYAQSLLHEVLYGVAGTFREKCAFVLILDGVHDRQKERRLAGRYDGAQNVGAPVQSAVEDNELVP